MRPSFALRPGQARGPLVVVFDSNPLIDLFDDQEVFHAVCAWLSRTSKAVLYLPVLAINEAMDLEEPAVLRRMRALDMFHRSAPGRIRVAAGPLTAIRAELECRQASVVPQPNFDLHALPHLSAGELVGLAKGIKAAASQGTESKGFTFALDRSLPEKYAAEVGQQFDAARAIEMIERSGELETSNIGIQHVVHFSKGKITAEELVRDPGRYPISNLLAHFNYRQMLANAVPPGAGHEVLQLFRTRKKGGRGDWYDSGIAAISALADALVTTDSGLNERCDWLRARGFLHFETVPLSELIA